MEAKETVVIEEALRQQREWLRVTLTSIGDAVLATDVAGKITFLNPVAARLTGWGELEALGQPAGNVFRIINELTNEPAEDIVGRVLREGCVISLANHTALVAKDGQEIPIEDSAAPIRNSAGELAGAVLVFHDVTEKRRAQEALRESELRVRRKLDAVLSPEGDIGTLELRDIIDVDAIQSLLEKFYKLVPITMAILDLKGDVLVGVGWQDVCTKFHRVHPEACRHCTESDTELSAGVPAGEFRLYKCRNNMWDIATPLMIGGRHVGNIFSGQFFFDDETPDRRLFQIQAQQYGFDEREYLAALDRAPRLSRAHVDSAMAFLAQLGHMLSLLSYGNIKLARSVAERDTLMSSLRESEERLKRAQEIAHLGSWELDVVRNRLTWSDEVYRIFGLQPQQFGATYEAFLEATHPDDRAAVDAAYSGSLREGRDSYEITHRVIRPSGGIRWVHEKCNHHRDAAGKIVRSVGMVQDVTEQKQAAKAVAAAFEQRRLALEAAELGAWEYRFDTGQVFWDERCRDLFGVAKGDQIEYGGAIDRIHPEDRQGVDEAVRRALAGADGGAYHREYRVVWPDGSVHWVASHGRVYFEASKPKRFIGVNTDITLRKLMEEELRQRAEEVQAVMEAAPVAIWVAHDRECNRITGNPTANRFYEAEAEENVSANATPARRFYRGGRELAAGELPMHEAAARGVEVRDSELEVLLPSGGRLHMLGQASPLRDARGNVRGCVGTFLDITERKRAERTVRESEERYRTLFNSMQEAFALGEIVCDGNGKPIDWIYLDVNPAFERMFGSKREEIVGRRYRELFPDAPWEYWVPALGNVALSGTAARLEQFGQELGRHFEAIAYCPRPGQFAAVFTDATERKRAAEALARQKQQYEALAENAPEVIARFDSELRHIYINDYGARVYGIPKAEVLGKTNAELGFPAEQVEFWKKHFDDVLATGRQRTVDFSFDSPSFGRQHFSSLFVPETDETGQVRSILAITRDVTEQKHSEERLRQSQKLESIGLLAGGIAHDFNNILTGVIGNASLALEMVDGETQPILESVVAQSERAAHLTRQLLAYSGKGQFFVQEVEFAVFLRELADFLRLSVPKSVELRFELQDRLPPVLIDASQLQQAVMNLVMNAGEALEQDRTPRASIFVSARSRQVLSGFVDAVGQEVGPGLYVCLEVSDNGPGMDEATKTKIFDPFFTTKFTGRGLGLAAVSGIVRTIKGGITLETAPGKGATFRIFFPAKEGFAASTAENGRDNRKLVLVVDDESSVRDFISQALKKHDYRVVAAADGREALSLWDELNGSFDLIILDVVLPTMGGSELLAEIKRRRRDIRVLLTSGYSEAEAKRLCSCHGGVEFIQKPYTAKRLLEMVALSLEARARL